MPSDPMPVLRSAAAALVAFMSCQHLNGFSDCEVREGVLCIAVIMFVIELVRADKDVS